MGRDRQTERTEPSGLRLQEQPQHPAVSQVEAGETAVVARGAPQGAGSLPGPRRWRSEDRLLVRTARKGGWWLVLLSLTTLVLAGVQVVLPAVLGKALDAVIGHASRTWLVWAVALLGIIVLGAALGKVAD